VINDHGLPGSGSSTGVAGGIRSAQEGRASDRAAVVVVLATAVRDVKTAVEAIKRGAYDYITKPFDVDAIVLLVHRTRQGFRSRRCRSRRCRRLSTAEGFNRERGSAAPSASIGDEGCGRPSCRQVLSA